MSYKHIQSYIHYNIYEINYCNAKALLLLLFITIITYIYDIYIDITTWLIWQSIHMYISPGILIQWVDGEGIYNPPYNDHLPRAFDKPIECLGAAECQYF